MRTTSKRATRSGTRGVDGGRADHYKTPREGQEPVTELDAGDFTKTTGRGRGGGKSSRFQFPPQNRIRSGKGWIAEVSVHKKSRGGHVVQDTINAQLKKRVVLALRLHLTRPEIGLMDLAEKD